MTKIITFDEAINIGNKAKGKKHLMLGNGFSVSLFPDIFNYKSLSEKVTDEHIIDLFKGLDTSDFEYVMWKLTEALQIIKLYENNTNIKDKMESDINDLKNTLIQVISKHHPKNPSKITEEQYNSCHIFLNHFDEGKKYTFNYDLLLYWVYMHFLDSDIKLACDDGFRAIDSDNREVVTWTIGREQNQSLYYLHGAMHIFSDGSDVEKYTWVNTDRTLSEQVRESIDKNKYPVFISEGTTEHKKKRINNNAYLARAFSSIKSITGNLYIYGHSIRDEDNHIFDYILQKGKIKNIFISIYGDKDSADNKKIIQKVNNWNIVYNNKNFYLYNAESANVWGHNNDTT